MERMTDRIERLKAELAALRPHGADLLPPDLQRSKDIELTYTSNAIEGNSLSLDETADIIEHGITVGGKRVSELFEAVDHYEALQWMRGFASSKNPLNEETVTELHRRVMLNSRKDIAGIYSQNARRIYGSDVVFPNPVKIPALMDAFGRRLTRTDDTPRFAFEAHYRLVTIHPFDDGNGRTARLLTNLILLRGGYVPVSIGPDDRKEHLETIRAAQLSEDEEAPAFQALMHRKLVEAMEETVGDLRQGVGVREGSRRDP